MDCHHIAGAENYLTPVLSNADQVNMVASCAMESGCSSRFFASYRTFERSEEGYNHS